MRFPGTKTRTVFLGAAFCALAAAGGSPVAAQPNVAINSWSLPGLVRSPYVRILNPSTTAPDYFSAPEDFSTDKSQNAIYVRFDNNSLTVIPNGAVTVTAEYAAASAGLPASSLAATVASLSSGDWRLFGSYVMNLVIPPGAPADYGLASGPYPTLHEVADPSRYRIECSVDCAEALPTSFFLRVRLTGVPGETDTSNNVALSYYDRGIPPVDVVILHDVSGSMSGQLALAKQRAKMFVDLMNIGDRVGVVAFSGSLPGGAEIRKPLGAPIAALHAADSAISSAKTAIDLLSAGGVTPMGSGVLKAQEVLDDPAASPYRPNRAIVMLTDGQENQPPPLKNPPGYPILAGLNTDPNGAIGLYPLWFGGLGPWGLALLQDIDSHVDVGKVVDQPDEDLKLAEAYLMIRGILTHDDVYAIHRGTTSDGYEGSILVDPVTRELILAAAWRSFERDLDISVLPPGEVSWRPAGSLHGSVSRDEAYVVHRLQNPSPGQWRYRLAQARPGEEYVLSALADQVEVLMQSSLEKASLAAGEPLVIQARLSRGGQGVPGALVRATVQAPDRALGTILQEHRGRFQTPSDPGLGVDVPRAAGIRKELQAFLGTEQLFRYSPNTVVLSDDDGDGNYTGRFDNTQVAGTYNVTIVAENPPGPRNSGFRREHRHAAVVSLGKIDPNQSVVSTKLLDLPRQEGAALWQISVVPADVHGNFANPGYGDRISVDANGGRWLTPLTDNDDGSYTRYLELPPGDHARISVTAFGSKLAERELTPGGAASGRRQFSLHSGTSFPSGSFHCCFDAGPSLTLDFGYRLKNGFTLLGFAGWDDFPSAAGSGNETVLRLSANLRKRWSAAKLSPYLQGGPGAYRIFGDWEAGANLGLGLTYQATPIIDIEAGADYHDVFLSGDDVRFWQVHLGFSILQ